MFKLVLAALGGALVSPAAAGAQQAVDPVMLEEGKQLYEVECALCHQVDGIGDPPTFPALSGNDQLGDLSKVASNIRLGQGNMPPFPDLSAEQIAAVATYIRNSWGNAHGPAAPEEVAVVLQDVEEGVAQVSVWDGVYTTAQAERGEEVYGGVCSSCHGTRLNGAADDPDMRSSPPLARVNFLRDWDGKSIATLFEYTRATMPSSNPGFLSDQEYIDIIAHMLASSNIPEGEQELATDPASLARIVIAQQP